MPNKSLPPIGLIAGSGPAPIKAAQALRHTGREVFIIGLEPHAEQAIESFPHRRMPSFDLVAILAEIKRHHCRELIISGGVLRPGGDVASQVNMPKGLAALLGEGRGDGALFAALADWLETKEGIRLVGVHEVCEALQAKEGLLVGTEPNDSHMADIALAAKAVKAIGALDVGQAAVVCRGLVLGLEAVEGTAAMLERVAKLPASLRGTAEHRAGVLVKLPRPHQDLRLDMPAIGVESVALAAKAGLAGIAVEAGKILLLDGAEAIGTAAGEAGLFIRVMPVGALS